MLDRPRRLQQRAFDREVLTAVGDWLDGGSQQPLHDVEELTEPVHASPCGRVGLSNQRPFCWSVTGPDSNRGSTARERIQRGYVGGHERRMTHARVQDVGAQTEPRRDSRSRSKQEERRRRAAGVVWQQQPLNAQRLGLKRHLDELLWLNGCLDGESVHLRRIGLSRTGLPPRKGPSAGGAGAALDRLAVPQVGTDMPVIPRAFHRVTQTENHRHKRRSPS